MKYQPGGLEDLLQAALAAALCAGEEILRVYSGADFHIQHKTDQSPVTLADTRAQAVIQEQLAPSGLPVLSEEGAADGQVSASQGAEPGRDRPGLDEIMRDGRKLPTATPGAIARQRPLTVIVSRHHPTREADLYPRFAPTMEWDTAAGEAVCGAAACRVTRRDGRTCLYYNKLNLENPWFMVQGARVQELVQRILQQ